MITMEPNTIVSTITSVGFPIFACLALGWFVYYQTNQNAKQLDQIRQEHKEEMKNLAECIQNNTLALQKLIDKIGD